MNSLNLLTFKLNPFVINMKYKYPLKNRKVYNNYCQLCYFEGMFRLGTCLIEYRFDVKNFRFEINKHTR